MRGEMKVTRLARLLRERAEMGSALKRAAPEAYQRLNQERIDRQHSSWNPAGRRRWRAVLMNQNSDHYIECARFILVYGLHPEEAEAELRDQWLTNGEPCVRPFAPRR